MIKGRPHHDLSAVQRRFAVVDDLEITGTAIKGARRLGYGLQDIVDAVQALDRSDFVKSETAHSPPNARVRHDTYKMQWDGQRLYLKFAGETLIDVTLTSFKGAYND